MKEQLQVIISAEIGKLKKNIKEGTRLIDKFGDDGEKVLSGFNDEFQKVGDISKGALAGIGVSIAGATTALLSLSGTTAEYRNEQAKLVTSFETAGASAETAKDTYNNLYRVLGDSGQAVEASAHLAKLTTNQQELSQWTEICQGVYATFGDSIPIEGLTEAVNETAKVGQVTGSLADALNWAGISEDAFNESLAECNTEAEREKKIRETLSGVYKEASDKYEENNKAILEQNEAQAKLEESTAKLGEAVQPINTMLTELGTTVLAELEPYITEFAEKYLPDISKALSGVGDAIGKVIMWIADNWELVSTLAIVITGIAVALSVFSTVMGVVNAVMMASPVTWIVLAIVAAVALLVAIIVLVIKYWDEIKLATIKCWNAIVEAVKVAIDWVISFFWKIIDFVKNNWAGLLLFLVNPFAGAFKLLYDNCDGFRETIDNLVSKIKGFFVGLWNSLKNGAKSAWDGVKSVFSKVGSFFKDTFTKAWTAVKNIFSKGGKIFVGIKEGIASTFKTIVNGLIGGINKVISVPFNAINTVLSKVKGISIAGLKPFEFISTISIPEIPKLARGGVVDSATLAMIGERGKEAVVPLENNLGWLDKLATMLNDRMGGNTPIVLNVDGKIFAQTAINTINDHTKQTGHLALNLV